MYLVWIVCATSKDMVASVIVLDEWQYITAPLFTLHSSNNAKKWEAELQTLKNNNARLTTALQESTTNVEEWQKQLKLYKEDNTRLKLKVSENDWKNLKNSSNSVLAWIAVI